MRFMGIFLTGLIFTTFSAIESRGIDTRVLPGEKALSGFLLTIGNYYRIPQTEVMIIKEMGIPAYEVPVLLFIAKRARVEPGDVRDFRLRNNTWLETTLRFGLSPQIFYVAVGGGINDALYGKAYGYYKHTPKKEWKRIVLSDDDIINLVNLKLLSEYYEYPPEKIIKMRSQGKEFCSINDEIRGQERKISDRGKEEVRAKNEGGKGKKEME